MPFATIHYNLLKMVLVAPLLKDSKFGKSLKFKYFRDFLFSPNPHIFGKITHFRCAKSWAILVSKKMSRIVM